MKDEKVAKYNGGNCWKDTEILNLQAVRALQMGVIAYLLHKGPTS